MVQNPSGTYTVETILNACYDATNSKLKLSVNTLDDAIFNLGTSSDIAMVLRSAVLNADAALTGVIVGTPDTSALAANSLIISNVTTDGDILIACSDGGHSKQMIFLDGSTGITHLGKPGTPVTATTGDVFVGGTLEIGGSSLKMTQGNLKTTGTANRLQVVRADDSTLADLAMNGLVFEGNLTSSASPRYLAAATVDTNYFYFTAKDTGVANVEVARIAGAADPYFSMGGSQQNIFYNSGAVTLGGNITVTAGKTFTGHNVVLENHTADDVLTLAESGSVHTNYGEDGAMTLTLPASATAGTHFKFMVGYAGGLRVKVAAASQVFIVNGATSTDDGGADMYLEADDEGEMADFMCIAAGVWLVDVIGTWSIVQP